MLRGRPDVTMATEVAEPADGPENNAAREIYHELVPTILGATPHLTGPETAQAAGLSLSQAQRLWRALGFVNPGQAPIFTDNDVAALALVAEAIEAVQLDFETMVRAVRAIGQTASRLAEWEVATLGTTLPEPATEAPIHPATRARIQQLAEELIPRFDKFLVYAWRRHLAAAIDRIAEENLTREEELTRVTVGFADMVRFTSLTNTLNEDQIGALVEEFESRCADVIAEHNGRLIKAMGDSVLFLHPDPTIALNTAMGIITEIGYDERLPNVRIGVATGSVVLRLGDVYGPPVNLAARLTTVARRNRIIIDQSTAELLPRDQFETRPIPARPLHGFGDVVPVTVRRTRTARPEGPN